MDRFSSIFCRERLAHSHALLAQQDFAAAYQLVVDPDTVFVACGFGAHAGRAGEQAHAGRSLEDVGAEGAPIDVEFDAEIAGFAEPGNLVAGIEHDGFGKNADEDVAISHGGEFTDNSRKFKGET
jgi:hypothetical protein